MNTPLPALPDATSTPVSFYYDRELKRQVARIPPGQFFAARGEAAMVSALGSCVSACIVDPVQGVGGMNHFMLPDAAHHGRAEDDEPAAKLMRASARYGAYAMEVLINRLLQLGAQRSRLVAQVFGGARVIPGLSDIGQLNIEFVISYLAREGIAVSRADLGGDAARKVSLQLPSGETRVAKLRSLHTLSVQSSETAFAASLTPWVSRKRAPKADVELF